MPYQWQDIHGGWVATMFRSTTSAAQWVLPKRDYNYFALSGGSRFSKTRAAPTKPQRPKAIKTRHQE